MANPLMLAFRKYPVTSWAVVGLLAYKWKASMVATSYKMIYHAEHAQREQELHALLKQ